MKMTIDNFKGIKHLELDFKGKSADIRAANGVGKSSIVDAFSWTLFNVDSHGNAPGSDAFREKPLDDNGEVIHNLTTSVELDFLLDGERFNIKREQSENWVKKRGSIEATFNGNVSNYIINDLPVKQTEFRQRIASIADDEIFRLVSSLGAFNALDWRTRRQRLLDLAGNDVDALLLARDEYRLLADEIGQRNVSADDLRKVLTEQRKSLNNALKLIPVRIDEARKSLPTFRPNEVADAEYMVNDAKRSIQTIEAQIIDAKAQGGVSNRSNILALEHEAVSIKRRMMDEHNAGKRKLQNEADTISAELRTAQIMLNNKNREYDDCGKSIEALQAQRQELLDEWNTIKKSENVIDIKCPTCGQMLPPDMIDDAKRRFEEGKRDKLSRISDEGKAVRSKLDDVKKWQDEVGQDIENLNAKIEKSKAAKDSITTAIQNYPAEPDFSTEPRLAEIDAELVAMKSEQAKSPIERIQQLEARKVELNAIIDKNNEIVQRNKMATETQERIQTYEKQQREYGAKLSETEVLIGLVEKFIADRCGALEDSINGYFPTVRWKLFDTQINGGIVDCCQAMIECNGAYVPYQSANTASQINCDIEIINALSDYYNVKTVLWIDNRERVNILQHADTQVITLAVSTDPELKIELKD